MSPAEWTMEYALQSGKAARSLRSDHRLARLHADRPPLLASTRHPASLCTAVECPTPPYDGAPQTVAVWAFRLVDERAQNIAVGVHCGKQTLNARTSTRVFISRAGHASASASPLAACRPYTQTPLIPIAGTMKPPAFSQADGFWRAWLLEECDRSGRSGLPLTVRPSAPGACSSVRTFPAQAP